ncbi:putative glucose-repressible alcohol dehydrogenase transcriptional effector-like protein [Diplonema papillatum]|nr:putative glucose-repressible alcohol dehydrogenase transcriptional effector-like protein [Diplonema papillatum]
MTLVATNFRKELAERYEKGALALVASRREEDVVRDLIQQAVSDGSTCLRLANFGELAEVPEEIELLTRVYSLSADNNYALRSIPRCVCHLSERLEELNLSYNALEDLPKEICSLRYLRKLTCSNNRLTWFPPNVDQLASLEHFNLDNNYITAFPPALGYVKNLKKFFIANNPLVDEDDKPPQPVRPQSTTECDLCKCELPAEHTLVMNFVDICDNKSVPLAYFLCGPRCEQIVKELRDSEQTNYRVLQYDID